MNHSIYTDAQWQWVADRIREGYTRKELSAFLGINRNAITNNLHRIGAYGYRECLGPLEDRKEEFLRLGEQPGAQL